MEFPALPDHLCLLVPAAREALLSLAPAAWGAPYPGSSAWSRKELLGHLIDSAVNNQQRFVRGLIEDELRFPSYAQEEMVRVQNYREADPRALLELWAGLNLHIAHVLRQTPPDKLTTPCWIGTNAAMPLEQLALDYAAHLEHHLRQLTDGAALPPSGLPWPPEERWRNEILGVSRTARTKPR